MSYSIWKHLNIVTGKQNKITDYENDLLQSIFICTNIMPKQCFKQKTIFQQWGKKNELFKNMPSFIKF